MSGEKETCFEWCFRNRPGQLNYTYCETVSECRREIERRYACTENDYRILKKQVRIVKMRDDMRYCSVVLHEEDVPEQRKEKDADKKGQRKCRSKQQDVADQRRPAAEQLMLLLVE